MSHMVRFRSGTLVTASVIGIATAAVQSIQLLATTIDNIKDAPNTVRNVVVH
ncbi:hypothetical protein B0J12DRAFT_744703 [Macrophomina phaseolina]|uniref:Uncharacterized protein n=1 Tax=Macrophomina phaseolina TaxID=35725 RepID=A0ABQ8FXK2_9PEZI|nr:hypothetical protein B0J12DRAFT_744703 [Macrophomina phaseolina]